MLILILVCSSNLPVQADTISSISDQNVTITFKVTDQWNTAFNAEIVIKNQSGQDLDNWAIGFEFPYQITNIWNGIILSHEDNRYIIKNAISNQDIPLNQQISFGFSALCTDSEVKSPENFKFLMKEGDVPQEDIETSFVITNKWSHGFNGTFGINNVSDRVIEDWKLEFDCSQNLIHLYDANVISKDGNHYIIKNAGYNANIMPGETISFGFSSDTDYIGMKPENIRLKNVIISENEEEPDLSKDTDHDKLTNLEENLHGTNPISKDSDGDGLSDYVEIHSYLTKPMNKDTDQDGISDGVEVRLGLDPLSQNTYKGIPDQDYTTTQTVPEDILQDINEKNPYTVGIEMKAPGYIGSTVSVAENSSLFGDNVAILGNAINIEYKAYHVDEMTLRFAIDDSYVNKDNRHYLNEPGLEGVQRYQIFHYDTEHGCLYPVKTSYDLGENEISAVTNKLGSYCIIDMDAWMHKMGITEGETIAKIDHNAESQNKCSTSKIKAVSENETVRIMSINPLGATKKVGGDTNPTPIPTQVATGSMLDVTEFHAVCPIDLSEIKLSAVPSKTDSTTDDDKDSKTNRDEIDWTLIQTSNDTLVLPTLKEYWDSLEISNQDVFSRIKQSNQDKINAIKVLPIYSNPAKLDTDGDDIPDGVDKEPLVVNTIETLFPLSNENHPNNPIYVEVDKNKITITAHIRFTGDADVLYPGTNKTYAEAAVEAIESKWKKDVMDPIVGTEYDFFPYLSGYLETKVIYQVPGKTYIETPEQKYITFNIDNEEPGWSDKYLWAYFGEEHKPYALVGGWNLNDPGMIRMFTQWYDQPGVIPYYMYQAAVAHEFGHILGISDAYPDANHNQKLVSNEEISTGQYCKTGSMMYSAGIVYANDI